MRMLQPSLQNNSTGLKRLVEQGAEEILRRWQAAVRAERAELATGGAEAPLLLDSIPLVLAEILSVIESDDGGAEPGKICRAARHGRERARQHLDVRDLMREYQFLRQHIFLYLHEHATQLAGFDHGDMMDICRRVGLAVDEAMCKTLSAFVEEQTGGLRHLSRTDSLTGLYNHRTFYERLDEELKRAERYEAPLSIVLIDLDDFKSVNDTCGHQSGDFLLIKFAELLRHELRQTDVICRYGGDEFGVILPETTREDARVMMCRLSISCGEFGATEGAPGTFGMSFGLSAHPGDDGTVTRLVKVADERLILNKREKKRTARPGPSGIYGRPAADR